MSWKSNEVHICIASKLQLLDNVRVSKRNSKGLWDACFEMEGISNGVVSHQLREIAPHIARIYELGVLVPTLPAKRQGGEDSRLAALYLKKALTDFRAMWVLLLFGYSSPAASVVASLYENALSVCAIAGKPENAIKCKDQPNGDLPWTPIQLAKMFAQAENSPSFENAWRAVYAGYKWLCQTEASHALICHS